MGVLNSQYIERILGDIEQMEEEETTILENNFEKANSIKGEIIIRVREIIKADNKSRQYHLERLVQD